MGEQAVSLPRLPAVRWAALAARPAPSRFWTYLLSAQVNLFGSLLTYEFPAALIEILCSPALKDQMPEHEGEPDEKDAAEQHHSRRRWLLPTKPYIHTCDKRQPHVREAQDVPRVRVGALGLDHLQPCVQDGIVDLRVIQHSPSLPQRRAPWCQAWRRRGTRIVPVLACDPVVP